ncbi:MAG: serine hydrolase, partial [Rhodospirillaceae bacterium]|nr:serine hydrolase [Rhodospirillaceae bacterium]
GDGMLLRPESMALITTNQLPEGRNIQFAGLGELPGKGHGLASAVSMAPLPHEAPGVVGEFWWGGIAGTQWWVSPNNNLAAVVMTQRQRAFSHPFAAELKKLTYDAVIT